MREVQFLLFFLLGLAMTLVIFPHTRDAQSASAAAQAPAPAATQAAAPARTSTGMAAPTGKVNLDRVVPAHTTIPLVLRNTINSRTARVGQAIYCETIFPITVNNRIIIPVGSSVKGSVTQVVRPGRVKGRAKIGLRFETLILPSGRTLPLRATLSGFAGTGKEDFNPDESKVSGASSKGEDAGKVAQTTQTGAVVGAITGAAKCKMGKGLVIGSLAGAAGGLIWVLGSRGPDVVLPSGTSLELELATPLTIPHEHAVSDEDYKPPSKYDEGPALPPRDLGPGF